MSVLTCLARCLQAQNLVLMAPEGDETDDTRQLSIGSWFVGIRKSSQ